MYHFKTTPFRGPQQRSLSHDTDVSGRSDDSTGSPYTNAEKNVLQEERSHDRAQKLQALYELSSDKDCSLNRNADFRTMAAAPISLKSVSPKEAAAAFQKREIMSRDGLQKSDKSKRHHHHEKVQAMATNSQSKSGIVTPPASESPPATSSTRTSKGSSPTTIPKSRSMDHPERHVDRHRQIQRTGSEDMHVPSPAEIQVDADHPFHQEGRTMGVQDNPVPLPSETSNPPIARTNLGSLHRGSSKNTHHSAMTPSVQKYAGSSSTNGDFGIPRNYTMDDGDDDGDSNILSIRRTGSGGLILQDKEAYYRVKALELQSRLENADNRDTSLNSHAVFQAHADHHHHHRHHEHHGHHGHYSAALKLSESMSPQDAAAVFRLRKQQYIEKHSNDSSDPLLTSHEREEKEKELAKVKESLEKAGGPPLARSPFRVHQQNIAPLDYQPSNGVLYDLPTLC